MNLWHKKIIYIFSFLGTFYPIFPLYGLMFSEVGNLSSNQIASLFLVWFISAVIWEIPTGVIADKFSRRNSTIFGYIATSLTFLIWIVYPNYFGYLIGFILWGLGFALVSGAWDSYLFTLLKENGEEGQYTKYVGRLESVGLVGMVCAYGLSALLIQYGYNPILAISSIVGVLTPLLLLMLPKDASVFGKHVSQIAIFRDAYREIKNNKSLLAIVMSISILGGFTGTLEEYVPLYYAWNGIFTQMVANILVVSLAVTSIVSWLVHRFEWLSVKQINLTTIVFGLFLFATGVFGSWIAILGLFIAMKAFLGMSILLYAKLQHTITGDARSTITSLATFQAEILAICFLVIYWLMSNFVSNSAAVYSLGLVVGIVLLVTRLRRIK